MAEPQAARMTAPTVTVLDVLTVNPIAHLDFDPEIPCELTRCRAGRPRADWIVETWAACGCRRTKACCEHCRHRLEQMYETHRAEPGPWRCLACMSRVDTHSTIRFTPLRETS